MRHRATEYSGNVETMDPKDGLARKLINSFEHLEEDLLLEQLAVPEDLSDPEGSVEMWVASTETYSTEEEIIVQGYLSLPTTVAIERNPQEPAWLLKEELLASEQFRHATTVAKVAGTAADEAPSYGCCHEPQTVLANVERCSRGPLGHADLARTIRPPGSRSAHVLLRDCISVPSALAHRPRPIAGS